MSDQKEPMPADGRGGVGREIARDQDPASAGRPDMEDNEGQSGGGPYPNPHNDPANADPENTFMGHGGQSDMGGMGDSDSGPDAPDDANG